MTGDRPPVTLLLDSAQPGWQNMAIDSALLDLAEEGAVFLRLYRWEPFCISFGRHEPAARRYDRARIAELGIDCVRRPTGGRAVWHARELTYAVAAPLAEFGGLKQAYREIHALLAAALATLGAPAELAGSPARAALPAAGPCFSSPAGGEVLLGSRKVVGSAQLRQGGAFLQHGSLLLEDDQSLLRDLAGLTGAPPETSLSEALGRPLGFAQAAAAVTREAAGRWSAVATTQLPSAVTAGAERHAARFRDEGWTWQR